MSEPMNDDLWMWFAPLWTDLRGIAPSLLLAGGYGLFLKQMWLIGERDIATEGELRTMVPVARWLYETPRVTRDFDFIASLGLIASPEDQRRTGQVLEAHGFSVVPENARWQFQRPIGNDEKICVDFHAPDPAGQREDLRWDDRRVKPRPSLGAEGIHGRTNPETAGCDLHPFSFPWRELEITVPNAVTWAVMKLVAMHDQWIKSQDAAASAEARQDEDFATIHAVMGRWFAKEDGSQQ